MSDGPLTTSPAAKIPATLAWSVVGSARRVPFAFVAATSAKARGVRGHADGRDQEVAVHREFAAGDRLGAAAPRRVGRTEGHLRAAQAAHRARRVGEDLGRGDEEGEPDAFALRVVDLRPVGRHLLPAAPVGDRHAGGPKASGGPRRIHRHVAAADDDDAPAGDVRGLPEPDVAQELDAAEDALVVLSGHAEARRARRPGRHENRVKPVPPERLEVPDRRARDDLDADVRDILDVPGDHVGGQAVGGDRQAQEAARLGRGLEDPDAVADPGQLPGGGQAGRAGAHDRDPLPVRRRHRHAGAVEVLVVPVVGEALEPADRQRPLQRAAGALGLARGVAGPTEGAREGRRLEDELECLLVLAAADQGDVAVGLDAGRTRVRAGRAAAAVDDCLLRHGLGKGDVGGPPGDHVGVELVGDGDGAGRLALLAARAGGLVDEAGLAPDPGVELPVPVALDPLDLAVGEGRDVVVVDRGRHLRRGDAARTVEGGEDLAEQDHLPADAGVLLDDEDLVAHVAELQG